MAKPDQIPGPEEPLEWDSGHGQEWSLALCAALVMGLQDFACSGVGGGAGQCCFQVSPNPNNVRGSHIITQALQRPLETY